MHTAMWKSNKYSHKRCQYLLERLCELQCSAYLTVARPVDADAVPRAVVCAGGSHVPLAPLQVQRQPPVDLGAAEAAAEAEVTHIVLHVEVTPASPVVEDTERDFW